MWKNKGPEITKMLLENRPELGLAVPHVKVCHDNICADNPENTAMETDMGQWSRTEPRNEPVKTRLGTEEALCEFTFHGGKQEPHASQLPTPRCETWKELEILPTLVQRASRPV